MANTTYRLEEVRCGDKRLEREFLDLPKKIYKGNPNWVCPFDSSILAVFDPAKNKLFKDGEAIRWASEKYPGFCWQLRAVAKSFATLGFSVSINI